MSNSTGNVFPTSGTSVDRAGATAWTSPGNVVSDNSTDTTSAVPTDYLVCTGFGFTIPTDATILGVTVRVEASETGTGSSNYVPQLISDATPTLIGTAKSPVTVSGTTKVISSNGGTADVWGASLTPAIVNAAGFGVAIWSTDTVNTLAIDYVTIAIQWSLDVNVTVNNAAAFTFATYNPTITFPSSDPVVFAPPRYQGSAIAVVTSDLTNHTFQLPKCYPGQLLLAITAWDGNPTITWDNTTYGAWSELLNTGDGTSAVKLTVHARVATSAESNGSIFPTLNTAEQCVSIIRSIADWEGSIANGIAVAAANTGSSTTPNPPNNAPGWGAFDGLWIAAFATDDGTITTTAYPAGYNLEQLSQRTTTSTGVGLSVASRQEAASSNDPGTFTKGDEQWVATTVAVRRGTAGLYQETAGPDSTSAHIQARIIARRRRFQHRKRKRDSVALISPITSALSPQTLAHDQALANATITEHAVLSPQALSETQTLPDTTLAQAGVLIPQALAHSQTLGDSTLTPYLQTAALAHDQSLGGTTLVVPQVADHSAAGGSARSRILLRRRTYQRRPRRRLTRKATKYTLSTAQALAHTHALTDTTVTQTAQVTPQTLAHAQGLADAPVIQHGNLSPQALAHAQALDASFVSGSQNPFRFRRVKQKRHRIRRERIQFVVVVTRTSWFDAALQSQALNHAHALADATIAEHAAITPQAVTHAHSLATPTLSIIPKLTAEALAHAQSLSDSGLAITGLLPGALLHAQAIDLPALVQHGPLAAEGLAHLHSLAEAGLLQHFAVTAENLAHAHSLPDGVLGFILLPAELAHGQAIDATTLVSHGVIVPATMFHEQMLADSSLIVAGAILGSSLLHAQLLDNAMFLTAEFIIRHRTLIEDVGHVTMAADVTHRTEITTDAD